MASLEDVVAELQQEQMGWCSWRIIGVGKRRFKTLSGSGVKDPLSAALEAAQALDPGGYQLWVTDSPKQIYSGPEIISRVKRFDVSTHDTTALMDERVTALLAVTHELEGQNHELRSELASLSKTLTEVTTTHARALSGLAEGMGKLVASSTESLGKLGEGHAELLGGAKDILVAAASDSRDQELKRGHGFWHRLGDELMPELTQGLKEAFPLVVGEGLPLLLKGAKWFLANNPPKGELP